MSDRITYQDQLEAQLDSWRAEIDVLKAKADKAEADTRVEYHRTVDRLREKQAAAERHLEKLKSAGDDAWRDVTSGVERAWETLGESVRSAAERFQ